MEKRFLLAFTLSLAVMLGYSYFVGKLYPPTSNPSKKRLEPIVPLKVMEETDKETLPSVKMRELLPSLSLETEKIKILVDPSRGSIQQIFSKEYKEGGKDPVKLLKVGDESYLIWDVWFKNTTFTQENYRLVEQDSKKLIFSAVLGETLIVEKKLALEPSGYTVTLSLTFKNQTPHTIPLYYELVGPAFLQATEERFFEAVVFSGGKRRSFHLQKLLKSPFVSEEKAEWAALKEKYFSLILRPEAEPSGYEIKATDDGKSPVILLLSTPKSLPPGEEITEKYLFYFGPNRLETIKKLGPWGEGVMNYGFFGGITKVILWSLTRLHQAVRSYGLSIVLLTILVSVLFLPLTGVSYNSMKRMRLLQPEVNKIRALYKDKPQKLNKELMALYKEHKVNPLGGCLPMLIQMPIFIAFYNALIYSIELKGAPFLFIKDLSLPDRAIPLPFHLGPLGDAINILPLLMMGAMVIQQKMSSSAVGQGPEADAQKMMTTFMPFIFGFIFYGLPSGLVLYWLTNNIVMIVTQKLYLSKGTL